MRTKVKLRLDTNTLRVEVYPTVDNDKSVRGTVQSYESSLGGGCPSASWSGPVNCICCGTEYEGCYWSTIAC
jgi:hypothetical protein